MRMYMGQCILGEDILLEVYPQIISVIGAALAWWLPSLLFWVFCDSKMKEKSCDDEISSRNRCCILWMTVLCFECVSAWLAPSRCMYTIHTNRSIFNFLPLGFVFCFSCIHVNIRTVYMYMYIHIHIHRQVSRSPPIIAQSRYTRRSRPPHGRGTSYQTTPTVMHVSTRRFLPTLWLPS